MKILALLWLAVLTVFVGVVTYLGYKELIDANRHHRIDHAYGALEYLYPDLDPTTVADSQADPAYLVRLKRSICEIAIKVGGYHGIPNTQPDWQTAWPTVNRLCKTDPEPDVPPAFPPD